MKKRILSLSLALVLVNILAACGGSANPLSDFNYKYDTELGGIIITGYTGSAPKVRIPKIIEDAPVVAIGKGVFEGSEITKIDIPSSVVSIGESAFSGCAELTSITIPKNVTSIGYRAFSWCKRMTSITIPDSVTTIGYDTFKGCTALKSITIPDSVTEIGAEAFSGCTGLTSIEIPYGVDIIKEGTFEGCSRLSSVTIPYSVTEIRGCWSAFYSNGQLAGMSGSFSGGAFQDCSALTDIIIPESVEKIGNGAFVGCNSLPQVVKNHILYYNEWAFMSSNEFRDNYYP